jgi:hypothetical protein
MAFVRLKFSASELIAAPEIIARLTLGSTSPTPPNGSFAALFKTIVQAPSAA